MSAPQVPNYRLVERLGSGAMASVWLAQRERSAEFCVLKVLHAAWSDEPVAEQRFVREAQIGTLLDHPNIARLHDSGRIDEGRSEAGWYLAMELIPGCDLERVLAKEPTPPFELTLAVAYAVLDALHYAHALKGVDGSDLAVVHRDVSPKNIMVAFDGRTKLIDFGMVRADVGSFKTQPGTIAGTLSYMSPEQAGGDAVDARSDLYSFASVLYELWTGRRLVDEVGYAEALVAVISKPPPAASTVNTALPRAVDSILAKALAKRPEQRFESAAALKSALMEALPTNAPMSAADVGAWMRKNFSAEHDELTEALTADGLEDTAPPPEPTRTRAQTQEQVRTMVVRRRRQPAEPVNPRPSRWGGLVVAAAVVSLVIAAGAWWASLPVEFEGRIVEVETVVTPSVEQRVALEPLFREREPPIDEPTPVRRRRTSRAKPQTQPPAEPPSTLDPKARLRDLYQRAVKMRDAATGRRRARIEGVTAQIVRESAAREVSAARVDALTRELESVGM